MLWQIHFSVSNVPWIWVDDTSPPRFPVGTNSVLCNHDSSAMLMFKVCVFVYEPSTTHENPPQRIWEWDSWARIHTCVCVCVHVHHSVRFTGVIHKIFVGDDAFGQSLTFEAHGRQWGQEGGSPNASKRLITPASLPSSSRNLQF